MCLREHEARRRSATCVLANVCAAAAATHLICLFMVIPKRMKKYMTKIGQYTGTSQSSVRVHAREMRMACVAESQNCTSGEKVSQASAGHATPHICCPEYAAQRTLNSGNLLMNGLNSSSVLTLPFVPGLPKTPLISPPPPPPAAGPAAPAPGIPLLAADADVGKPGSPSSMSCDARSSYSCGSNLGCRKARKRLRR